MSQILMHPTRSIQHQAATNIYVRQFAQGRHAGSVRQPPFSNPSTVRRRYPVPFRSFSIPGRCWIGITPAPSRGHRLIVDRPGADGQWALMARGPGTQFKGNCAIGGTWYTGTNFRQPIKTDIFADWGQGLIRPSLLTPTTSRSHWVVSRAMPAPSEHRATSYRRQSLYIGYNFSGRPSSNSLTLATGGDRSCIGKPVLWPHAAGGAVEQQWSSDPVGSPSPTREFWDGSPVSTQANRRTLSLPSRRADEVCVTLTVTDSGGCRRKRR